MTNKVVVITGACSGIGKSTAMAYAKLGAQVVLISNNKTRLAKTMDEICEKTKNNTLRFFVADLSLRSETWIVANYLKSEFDQVDILINNAGAVFSRFEKTSEGFEKTIATNYFGAFHLSFLLLQLLRKSGNGRIINIGSDIYSEGNLEFESFTKDTQKGFVEQSAIFLNANFKLKVLFVIMGFRLITLYAQSKLALVLFTRAFSAKEESKGVSIVCVHPGMVNTNIIEGERNILLRWIWSCIAVLGGQNLMHVADEIVEISKTITTSEVQSVYYKKGKPVELASIANNDVLGGKLWAYSVNHCTTSKTV